MTYRYGGHPDHSEYVYWLDETGRPVARMLFSEFSRLCGTGESAVNTTRAPWLRVHGAVVLSRRGK